VYYTPLSEPFRIYNGTCLPNIASHLLTLIFILIFVLLIFSPLACYQISTINCTNFKIYFMTCNKCNSLQRKLHYLRRKLPIFNMEFRRKSCHEHKLFFSHFIIYAGSNEMQVSNFWLSFYLIKIVSILSMHRQDTFLRAPESFCKDVGNSYQS
jgi:hypothetical protein